METTLTVSADDFQKTIDEHLSRGFRLLMIKPADAPTEALLENVDETVHIRCEVPDDQHIGGEWSVGRAGMMYRDLIPDRLGGKLIASHIRILDDGPVPDDVHYHKIDFQVIYCLKGVIKVVYEDQGPPFWLRPGDCVLQPPEIRHRVLEAEAGSEVIEITSPAEHETWFDHEMELPTNDKRSERVFGTQRFALHSGKSADWRTIDDDLEAANTTIGSAGQNAPQVNILRSKKIIDTSVDAVEDREVTILIDVQGIRLQLPGSN